MNTQKPLIVLLLFMISSMSWAQSTPELRINFDGFEKKNKVEIYPNPTVDYLNIVIENSDLKAPKIEVFDIIGNVVNVDIDKIELNKYIVDVKNLPAGYYLVTIEDINGAPIRDMFKFLKR